MIIYKSKNHKQTTMSSALVSAYIPGTGPIEYHHVIAPPPLHGELNGAHDNDGVNNNSDISGGDVSGGAGVGAGNGYHALPTYAVHHHHHHQLTPVQDQRSGWW